MSRGRCICVVDSFGIHRYLPSCTMASPKDGRVNEQIQTQVKPAEKSSSLAPTRSGLLQRKCACGGTPGVDGLCAECRRKRPQRRSAGRSAPSGAPPTVPEVLRSTGQPLDEKSRSSMEPRVGFDFSGIPVHSDTQAADSARAVHPLTHTRGPHVEFFSGRDEPRTRSGRLKPKAEDRKMGSSTTASPRFAHDSSRTSIEAEGTVVMPGEEEQTQAPPTSGSAAPPSAPAGCRCCPVSMEIQNVNPYRTGNMYGHSFDVVIGLEYDVPPGRGSPIDCELVWRERTDRPPTWQGVEPNTWNDMFKLFPGSPVFAPWTNRTKPCPGTETVTLTDPPATSVNRPARTLEFDLDVRGRTCGTQTVRAKQVLEPDGAGDIKTQTFSGYARYRPR
jgi:hypothetical protein